jgi:flavin reductase (DIM6/NTAB) family NADH-FMN oxidoreductase RutF
MIETLAIGPLPFFRPRFRGASLAVPRSSEHFTRPFRYHFALIPPGHRFNVAQQKGGERMTAPKKLDQPPKYWDRLFAPSSCLAMITTVDAQGRVNAASYGTCTRVHHEPVFISFTANVGADNANNILVGSDFVVNLPRWERESLEKVRVVGLPFEPGISEIDKAGLTALPSTIVKPPRIAECSRHFECKVEWTKEWSRRLMVVGRVVAASVDADCVDAEGYVLWDKVKSAHYCGAPYGGRFVAAYETMAADVPYDGPEVEAFIARERALFKEH